MHNVTCNYCDTSHDSEDLPKGPDGNEYCPNCHCSEFTFKKV